MDTISSILFDVVVPFVTHLHSELGFGASGGANNALRGCLLGC